MGRDNQIYVMDTGNSRIKVLDADLVFSHHITCPQLEGRSVTGERWREMVVEYWSVVCRTLSGSQ